MDTAIGTRPRRWVIRLTVVAAILVVALAVAAIALLAWVRSYQPIATGAFGYPTALVLQSDDNDYASGVAVLRRPAEIELDLTSQGSWHWPITIDRVDVSPARDDAPGVAVTKIRAGDMGLGRTLVTTGGPATHIRLSGSRSDPAALHLTLRPDCRGAPRGSFAGGLQIRLHYRYLRFFSRTQAVEPPFQIASACP